MGYFSDGFFTGMLASVRETGRKFKNGAKELVEDFISGFNGHGWKLWKRGDSWRLELDELLVRKSFQVFELIINQITAIKGSQAITQGHAKIKDVTVVESADVYREVAKEVYALDFSSYNWAKVGIIDSNSLIITHNELKFDAINNTTTVALLTGDIIPAMTVEISNLTGVGGYEYFDNDRNKKNIYFEENGRYELPYSNMPPNVLTSAGFSIEPGGAITVKQIPLRTEITETITQEPCYRIQIDDELNSITEYDLLRCQKGNKFYYVQVGSVFQYYINIPLSEFDTNEEGTVMNPPQAGDELVQFGNASHQEKYANRHSAIYLHVDEDEPAIDLMTDIYSKDWSEGNILKTRIGGNLPGTDGERGFYCVNGKLLFVDEQGDTVSVINPDGSASFARGQISWTKDGNPYFKGYIISGDSNGKRMEINPGTGAIDIYDEESTLVNRIESQKYSDPLDFFQSNVPNFTIITNLIGFTINYFPFEMTNFLFKDENGNHGVEISEHDNYYLYYSHDIDFRFTSGTYTSLNITLNLIVEKEDGTITTLYTEEYTEPKTYYTTGVRPFALPKIPGYYTPKIQVKITGYSSGYFTFAGKVTQHDSYIRNLKYKSSFFSQGLALGTDDSNVAMIWNSTKEEKTGNVLVDLENKVAGIRINTRGIYIKYGLFANAESYWMSMSPMFMYMKITKTGGIVRQSTFFGNDYNPTVEKTSLGKYSIIIHKDIVDQFHNMIPFGIVIPDFPSISNVPITGYANVGSATIYVTLSSPNGLVDAPFQLVLYAIPTSYNANQDFKE